MDSKRRELERLCSGDASISALSALLLDRVRLGELREAEVRVVRLISGANSGAIDIEAPDFNQLQRFVDCLFEIDRCWAVAGVCTLYFAIRDVRLQKPISEMKPPISEDEFRSWHDEFEVVVRNWLSDQTPANRKQIARRLARSSNMLRRFRDSYLRLAKLAKFWDKYYYVEAWIQELAESIIHGILAGDSAHSLRTLKNALARAIDSDPTKTWSDSRVFEHICYGLLVLIRDRNET